MPALTSPVQPRAAFRLRIAVRLVLLVAFLAPVAFLVAGSLRRPGLPPPKGLELVPPGAGVSAYEELPEYLPLLRLVGNSVLVTAVAVPVTVLLASWAGFALAQLSDRPRRLLLAVTIVMVMIPLPMLWVARFVLYQQLRILDTPLPLMAPALAATTPFTVLLAYLSFRRIPPVLFEAARLEGASAIVTWWRVGLPLVRSTTTAIAAIAFVFHWGNFLDAALFAQGESSRTLPLGVGELAQLDPSDYSVLLAGAVLLVLPPLVALAFAQKPLLSSVDVSAER